MPIPWTSRLKMAVRPRAIWSQLKHAGLLQADGVFGRRKVNRKGPCHMPGRDLSTSSQLSRASAQRLDIDDHRPAATQAATLPSPFADENSPRRRKEKLRVEEHVHATHALVELPGSADEEDELKASSRNLFSLPAHCAHHEVGVPLPLRNSDEPRGSSAWVDVPPRRFCSEKEPVTPTRQQKAYSLFVERTVPRSLAKAMTLENELLSVQTAHARLQTTRGGIPKDWWQSKNDVLRTLVVDVDHVDLEGASDRRRRYAIDIKH
eukprot:jgi/Mesvir1/4334/Mv01203-RA.1